MAGAGGWHGRERRGRPQSTSTIEIAVELLNVSGGPPARGCSSEDDEAEAAAAGGGRGRGSGGGSGARVVRQPGGSRAREISSSEKTNRESGVGFSTRSTSRRVASAGMPIARASWTTSLLGT